MIISWNTFTSESDKLHERKSGFNNQGIVKAQKSTAQLFKKEVSAMPRLKQQNPKHIIEDHPNTGRNFNADKLATIEYGSPEASVTDRDCTSEFQVSPARETLDQQSSESAVSSPREKGSNCGVYETENTADVHNTHRDTSPENIFDSDRNDGVSAPVNKSISVDDKKSIAPFVTIQSSSPQNLTCRSPRMVQEEGPRQDYSDFLKAIISHNIRSASGSERENGERYLTKNGLKNSTSPVASVQQAAMFNNVMSNPLQLMAKLLYASQKTSADEIIAGKQDIYESYRASAKTNQTLNDMTSEELDSRSDQTGSTKGMDSSDILTNRRDSSGSWNEGRNSSSPGVATTRERGNVFRPFLPSEQRRSPYEATGKGAGTDKTSLLDSNESMPNGARFPVRPWSGLPRLLAPPPAQGITKSLSPSGSDAMSTNSLKVPHVDEKKENSSSPDPLKMIAKSNCLSPTMPSINSKRSPSRSVSPSPLWAGSRKPTNVPSYMRRVDSPEKYIVPYGYSALTGGHSAPFPLPIPHLPDFSTVPASPYYNPWGMMYPPMHTRLDSLPGNHLLQSLHMRESPISKTSSGLTAPRPSSNPPYSRKPSLSRNKAPSTNPIDMYHAAIVREAKEANKGMDPENMYIECPICHKKIKRLYHFQRHMRIHSGDKNHACPYCPYKSVRKDNLKSHLKTHEKSKYDGPRRVQTKRDSAPRTTFPSAPVFHPPHNASKDQRSVNGPTSYSPFESKSPPSTAQRPSSKKALDIYPPKQNPVLRDMALLSTVGYFPQSKFDLHCNGYPPLPPFYGFPQKKPRSPTISITEIDTKQETSDNNRSRSKSPEMRVKCESGSGKDSPQKRENIPEVQNEFEPPVKKSRSTSFDSKEPLLLGNSNNSNNFVTNSHEKPEEAEHRLDDQGLFPTKNTDMFHMEERRKREATRIDSRASMNVCKEECRDIKLLVDQKFHPFSAQNGEIQCRFDYLAERSNTSKCNEKDAEVIDNTTWPARSPSLRSVSKESSISPREVKNEPNKFAYHTPGYAGDERHKHAEPGQEEVKEISSTNKEFQEQMTSSNTLTDGCLSAQWLGVGGRESKCRLCDFTAPSSAALQEHMTSHKEDGLYKCQQCDYHGKNLSKLIEHIRIHTGERPFQCDQCSYAAKRKDNLAQHKSVRHDKTRFKSSAYKVSPDESLEHETSRKSPEDIDQIKKSEYASVDVSSGKFLNNMDARLGFPNGKWTARFENSPAHDTPPIKTVSRAVDYPSNNSLSPHLLHRYFLPYANMAPSIMYSHPLMTSSVFPAFTRFPMGGTINGGAISPDSPNYSQEGKSETRNPANRELKAQECAR